MMINYNCGADLSRGTRIRHEWKAKCPCSMGAPFQLGTRLSIHESRLIESPLGSVHNFRGFFIAQSAACEYARDNQRNDISGNATRTRAGSSGGLRIEPAWEYVRLFGQPFEPIAQDTCKSVHCVTRDGSVERTLGRAKPG